MERAPENTFCDNKTPSINGKRCIRFEVCQVLCAYRTCWFQQTPVDYWFPNKKKVNDER